MENVEGEGFDIGIHGIGGTLFVSDTSVSGGRASCIGARRIVAENTTVQDCGYAGFESTLRIRATNVTATNCGAIGLWSRKSGLRGTGVTALGSPSDIATRRRPRVDTLTCNKSTRLRRRIPDDSWNACAND